LAGTLVAQQPGGSSRTFANRCTICHGGDGNGTDRAPAILTFVAAHSDAELATLVRTGRLEKGMPRFDFTGDEMAALLAHLRGLVAGTAQADAEPGAGNRGVAGLFQPHPVSLKLQDGRTLQGTLTS
jgi:alcohol dehydrogenase (cytochrome c)